MAQLIFNLQFAAKKVEDSSLSINNAESCSNLTFANEFMDDDRIGSRPNIFRPPRRSNRAIHTAPGYMLLRGGLFEFPVRTGHIKRMSRKGMFQYRYGRKVQPKDWKI